MKEIKISGNKGKGLVSLVSDEDFEILSKYNWTLDSAGYPVTNIKTDKRRSVKMHKLIFSQSDSFVDHKNRNKLDNRRENLRVSDKSKNNHNRGIQINNTTGYKGVVKSDHNGFKAQINHNGMKIYIGTFSSKEEAAVAYNEKAIELFGKYASLNEGEELVGIKAESSLEKMKRPYKGVYRHNIVDGWVARSTLNKKQQNLGIYTTPEEAALAYNDFIIRNNLNRKLNIIK